MRKVKLLLGVAALAVIVAFAAAAPVAAAGGPEIASMTAGATALVWQPTIAYQRMVLTVSGPDGVFSREFDAATLPSLDVFGADGHPLADGGYNWELRAVPVISDKVRSELARARATGDESRLADLRRRGELPSEPMVVSGHFRVHEGAFVQGDADEAAAGPGDAGAPQLVSDASVTPMFDETVISGDLTVYNSLCVGVDCATAESYGADTIRLKENNLRIHFDDTSSAAGFPNRDWRLVANDQASGGRNVFYLEDSTAGTQVFSIEAGAGNNALYVDDVGHAGFGTSTPVLDLHVVTGNTPALRLEQDGSSGFTPQTWDVAGNEANFFVRDVTGGSALPFRIEPGTATNTLYLDNQERVGVGTNAPDATVHVRGTAGTSMIQVEEASTTNATRTLLTLENNGRVDFRLIDSGSGGEWTFSNAVLGNQLIVTRSGTGVNEMVLDSTTGNLTIQGDFVTPTNTYPDYVFEAGYPLMPLADLREFIGENGHLPNVPSEAEARESGLRLADMQVRLLEKVEELTLYTLHQDELIATLQARLESLEKERAAEE